MQVVKKEGKLVRAASSCADRGRSSFGDARVYLERYLTSPKHIEVQILCGQRTARWWRWASASAACSGATRRSSRKRLRRHRFSPVTKARRRRQALHASAVAVASSAPATWARARWSSWRRAEGELFFLEVNARLQVEHGVTELCTGIDLVEQQLRVAAGERLSEAVTSAHAVSGHAIEARIYAEDPARRFAPQPGTITQLSWPAGHEWRSASIPACGEGQEITPYYDPLLAKLLAYGADSREQAIERLDAALAATTLTLVKVPSALPTPISRSAGSCMAHSPPFRDGSYDTLYAEALAKGKGVRAGHHDVASKHQRNRFSSAKKPGWRRIRILPHARGAEQR